MEEGRKLTLTDTVGFIQKLPTTLVESFKSTLAEARAADLLLLVVDASDQRWRDQMAAVVEILRDIDSDGIKRVLVLNKIDLLTQEQRLALKTENPDAVLVSAEDGVGINNLLYRIGKEASESDETITALIPYSKGLLLKMCHERCQVIRERYVDEGLLATLKASEHMRATLEPYRVDDDLESNAAQ